MNKKILLSLMLAILVVFTACGKKDDNEETREETQVETNEEVSSDEDEDISVDEENKDLTSEQKFVLKYFNKLLAGEIDIENTYIPKEISKENVEKHLNEYITSFDFDDIKEKAKSGVTIEGSQVVNNDHETIFRYEVIDKKVLLEDLYIKDVFIKSNKNLEFIINGVNSKDLNLKYDEDKRGVTIGYALPKTTIKVENKVLGDMEKEISLYNGQEIMINEIFSVPEKVNQTDVSNLAVEVSQALIDLLKGKTDVDTVIDKYFEEGTPSSLLQNIKQLIVNANSILRNDYDYRLKNVKSVDYSFNDTVRVVIHGATGNTLTYDTALWITYIDENTVKVSKYQPADALSYK